MARGRRVVVVGTAPSTGGANPLFFFPPASQRPRTLDTHNTHKPLLPHHATPSPDPARFARDKPKPSTSYHSTPDNNQRRGERTTREEPRLALPLLLLPLLHRPGPRARARANQTPQVSRARAGAPLRTPQSRARHARKRRGVEKHAHREQAGEEKGRGKGGGDLPPPSPLCHRLPVLSRLVSPRARVAPGSSCTSIARRRGREQARASPRRDGHDTVGSRLAAAIAPSHLRDTTLSHRRHHPLLITTYV
jgi:hypothetical protein